jgi:hypothetical protein
MYEKWQNQVKLLDRLKKGLPLSLAESRTITRKKSLLSAKQEEAIKRKEHRPIQDAAPVKVMASLPSSSVWCSGNSTAGKPAASLR